MTYRILAVALALAGCSREEASNMSTERSDASPAVAGAVAVAFDEAAPMPVPAGSAVASRMMSAASAPLGAQSRLIVRNAKVSMQVADVRRAVEAATALALGTNGFVGDSRFWRDGQQDLATITLRVPSEALDATLGKLRALSVRVDNESMSGEDVTRQVVDLGARLTNLRATEAELRGLLATVRQRSQKAADILEVHTELSRIRGEIEQHTAALQSLTQLAAMSTIALELRPDVVSVPVVAEGWQPRGVLHDATRALVSTGREAVKIVIWGVVYVAPLLLTFSALVYGLRVLLRSVRRRRTVAVSAAG